MDPRRGIVALDMIISHATVREVPMAHDEIAVRPQAAQEQTCPCCGHRVWQVTSTAGVELLLDLRPDSEWGSVEMVVLSGVYQARVLVQRESLFDVDDRPRWRAHSETCTRTCATTAGVPVSHA